MTPLMYAIATDHGDLEIVKTLIARGADLTAKTLDGETATDWAHKSGATPVAALLERAGGKTTPPAAPALPEPARDDAASRRRTQRRPARARVGHLLRQQRLRRVSRAERDRLRGVGGADAPDSASMTSPPPSARTVRRQRSAPRRRGCSNASTVPHVDILLYTLGALAAAGYPPDRATDAMLFNVLAQQRADGQWHVGGVTRPPMEDGDFTRTALGIRAHDRLRPPARAAEMKERTREPWHGCARRSLAPPKIAVFACWASAGVTPSGASSSDRPATSSRSSEPTAGGDSATRWRAMPTRPA